MLVEWHNRSCGMWSLSLFGLLSTEAWHCSDASLMFPRRVVALGRYWSDLRSCSTQQKLGPYGGEVCRVLGDQAPWNQISKTPVLAFTKVVTVMGHAQHRNGWGKQAEAAREEGKWPGDVVGGQVEPSGSLLECSQQLHRIAAPHGSCTVDTKEVLRSCWIRTALLPDVSPRTKHGG